MSGRQVGSRERQRRIADGDIFTQGIAGCLCVLGHSILNVGREAVQARLEICLELLLACPRLEVAQRELRRVAERLPGGLTKRLVLIRDPGLVEGPSCRGPVSTKYLSLMELVARLGRRPLEIEAFSEPG